MNRQEEIIEEIEKQLCRVRRELKGYKVFLFGTRAAGVAHKHSDFDIGILGDRPIPLKTFFKIEDLFDSIDTLYTIDWVDLNRSSASFREEALKNMEILFGL